MKKYTINEHISVGWDDEIETFFYQIGEKRTGHSKFEIMSVIQVSNEVENKGFKIPTEIKLKLCEDFSERSRNYFTDIFNKFYYHS